MYDLTIPGWQPEVGLQVIARLAQLLPPYPHIVEIGPFCGRTTVCLAMTRPDAKIQSIDIFDTTEHPYYPPVRLRAEFSEPDVDFGLVDRIWQAQGTLQNFKYFTRQYPNVTAIKARSPDGCLYWKHPADLVLIDAVHHNPYFQKDIEFWWQHVKMGGIMAGDDCAETHPDVRPTLEAFCDLHKLTFTVEHRIWAIENPVVLPFCNAWTHPDHYPLPDQPK